jgi:hypothetical protein
MVGVGVGGVTDGLTGGEGAGVTVTGGVIEGVTVTDGVIEGVTDEVIE